MTRIGADFFDSSIILPFVGISFEFLVFGGFFGRNPQLKQKGATNKQLIFCKQVCYTVCMFAVVYTKNAQKTLLKMPRPTAQRIRQKIEEVATDPYQMHQNVKKLSNSDQFRLRVGSWRILYQIQDEKLVIVVVKVAPRGGAYKK